MLRNSFLSSLILAFGASLIGATVYLRKKEKKSRSVSSQTVNEKLETTEETIFTVFTWNDIYEMLPEPGGVGGFAEIKTILDQQRASAKHHITTVNGDFLNVTSLSQFHKGAHMVHILNEMNIDFVVAGNHEFDYGPEQLRKRIAESKFRWFGSNILEEDGKTIFDHMLRTCIIEVEGFKIGIFGVCTQETNYLSFPGYVQFADIFETSQTLVTELQSQGAEVIIALTHQWLPEDISLARKVKGIHLLLGGHDHTAYSHFEGHTLIHKSGQNCEFLGRIDLRIKRSQMGTVQVIPSYTMIANVGYPKDPKIEAIVDQYMQELRDLEKIVCAVTMNELSSETSKVRRQETAMGNLLADSARDFFKSDIAIIQGGTIRGNTVYPKGTVIKASDVVRELPFSNLLKCFRLSGRDLKQAFEEGVRHLPHPAGCFPQVSGLKMTIRVANPVGERISDIKIGEEDLDYDRVYTIVTTEFISKGGDGYKSLAKGDASGLNQSDKSLTNLFKDYITEKAEIFPLIDGRINIHVSDAQLSRFSIIRKS